jgi:hypothetical protein
MIDCSEDGTDILRGDAGVVVARMYPAADFFLRRFLGRCCSDGSGDRADDRSGDSGLSTVGKLVSNLT